MHRFLFSLSTAVLLACCVPAHAQADQITAVEHYCGQPKTEHEGISPVSNRLQRDLTYGNTILHFIPNGSGWTFTTAWRAHLPISGRELQTLMPCFGQAVTAAAALPTPAIDPTIANQAPALNDSRSTIPHLSLILFLAIAVVMLLLWPRRLEASYRVHPSAQRLRRPRRFSLLRRHPLTDL